MAVSPRSVRIATAGTLVAMLSYTAPLGTLPDIAADLAATPAAQSITLSGASLGLTVALLSAGALGDDRGRRRIFVVGAVVLALTSAMGALAPTAGLFALARVLQGMGAAAVIASALALIGAATDPGPARTAATGLWGAGLAAGIGLGPFLAVGLGWRPAYAAIGASAVLTAVVARRWVPESRSGLRRRVDVGGIVLLAAGLGLLGTGLALSRGGWSVPVLLLVPAGVAGLAAFLAFERRIGHPMLPLALFGSRRMVAATIGALASGLGVIAVVSYFATVAQRALGLSAPVAATVVVGWPATSVLASLLTRRIPDRVSGPSRLAAGLVVVAAGLVLLIGVTPGSALRPAVAFLLAGVGTGVVNATLGREAVASVPADRAGVGSGINNTARYLGAAVGVSVVATLANRHPEALTGWHQAVAVAVAVSLIAAALIMVIGRARAPGAAAT